MAQQHIELVTVTATAWVGPERASKFHLAVGGAPGCAGKHARPAATVDVDVTVDRGRPGVIVDSLLALGGVLALTRLSRVLDPSRLCLRCSDEYVDAAGEREGDGS